MGRAIQFAAVSSGVSSVKRGLASQEGFQDGSILPEFPFNCRRRKSVDGLRDVHGFVNLSVLRQKPLATGMCKCRDFRVTRQQSRLRHNHRFEGENVSAAPY
jgi:hypothetical protein